MRYTEKEMEKPEIETSLDYIKYLFFLFVTSPIRLVSGISVKIFMLKSKEVEKLFIGSFAIMVSITVLNLLSSIKIGRLKSDPFNVILELILFLFGHVVILLLYYLVSSKLVNIKEISKVGTIKVNSKDNTKSSKLTEDALSFLDEIYESNGGFESPLTEDLVKSINIGKIDKDDSDVVKMDETAVNDLIDDLFEWCGTTQPPAGKTEDGVNYYEINDTTFKDEDISLYDSGKLAVNEILAEIW